ncbi:MAG TPA: aldo/keto reductase [Gemmatimonadales bacterium]|nr:aldo/keto reductase [Gemmatimonadales bacterium]
MKTRPLGNTGYRVSEIGFGAWGLGGVMWRGVDEAEGRKALREAVDQGITFFDTALAYGSGHSERVIGEVLKDDIRANRVVVATKVPPKNQEWPAKASYKLNAVFPAKHIASSTEQSLKNLRMEALHLQQLHVWNDVWLSDPEWQTSLDQIARLKKEGKVLHWGISINDHAPETALKVLTDPIFETAQVIYNIYDRSPEKALFALARKKPLGIIVRVPFDEGALTGQIKANTVFPAGDWRDGYFAGDRKAEAEKRAQALSSVLDEQVQSLPELALRFVLSSSEVSTVIPGMRRPAHVRQNTQASAKGALPAGMLAKLKPHAWDKNWYP